MKLTIGEIKKANIYVNKNFKKEPVNGFQRVKPCQQAERITNWQPPDLRWINVNFDGAARGNPGPSSAGCVAKDRRGVVMAKCKQRLEVGSNNEAEVKAALLAVQLAGRLGVENLHLEGDSQIITHAIIKGKAQNWKIDREIKCIRNLLASF